MIKEWRTSWGQGDIPFLFVQLPRFETKTRYWNELREAQYLTSLRVKIRGWRSLLIRETLKIFIRL